MHQSRKVTQAVFDALVAAGIAMGDGIKPANAGPGQGTGGAFKPYGVLFPLPGGVASGPLDAPEEDFESLLQVTCIGESRYQAEWVADKVRAVMINTQFAIDGRSFVRARTDMEGGIQRDDDVQPPQFYKPERYRLVTTT